MANNYIRGVGRLAVDRYQFQDHVDGYSFNHTADSVELNPHLNIDGERSTVQAALEAALPYLTTTSIPDANVTGTKGLITLAGGDLAGSGSTATSVKVSGLQGTPISPMGSITSGYVLSWNGSSWVPAEAYTPSNQFIGTGAPYNTGFGYSAGKTISTGSYNTCIGFEAAKNHNSSNIVAIGFNAGGSSMSDANYSTLVGSLCMYNLVNGFGNTAVGYQAGYSATTSTNNVLMGYNAAGNLVGGGGNVILGYNAASSLYSVTCNGNVCVGLNSGLNVNNTSYNTFIGTYAGKGKSTGAAGSYNISIGYNSLYDFNDGDYNIGIGVNALYKANQGNYNIGIGINSLYNVDDGNYCIAIGSQALQNATYGLGSIAIGSDALGNESNVGTYNVAIGYEAGKYISGNNNIAIGPSAMLGSSTYTTGGNNICIGNSSGSNLTTGEYNVSIGHSAQCGTTVRECIAIGREANASTTNGNIQLGTGDCISWYPGYCTLHVGKGNNPAGWAGEYYKCFAWEWNSTSDERVKENINTLTSKEGLEFINNLNPVSYNMKYLGNGDKEEFISKRKMQFGLIAQQVKSTIDQLNLPPNDIYSHDNDSDGWSLNYNAFIAPLIKSVQELSQKVNKLENDNENLRKEIEVLKTS